MKEITKTKLEIALKEVESNFGIKIPKDFANEIKTLCIRKLQLIKKDENYLPILYRDELQMKFQGKLLTELSLY